MSLPARQRDRKDGWHVAGGRWHDQGWQINK